MMNLDRPEELAELACLAREVGPEVSLSAECIVFAAEADTVIVIGNAPEGSGPRVVLVPVEAADAEVTPGAPGRPDDCCCRGSVRGRELLASSSI